MTLFLMGLYFFWILTAFFGYYDPRTQVAPNRWEVYFKAYAATVLSLAATRIIMHAVFL